MKECGVKGEGEHWKMNIRTRCYSRPLTFINGLLLLFGFAFLSFLVADFRGLDFAKRQMSE